MNITSPARIRTQPTPIRPDNPHTKICSDCNLPINGAISHLYKCSFVPKCPDCKIRTDIPDSHHVYTCIYTVKCSECQKRMDTPNSHHTISCSRYRPSR